MSGGELKVQMDAWTNQGEHRRFLLWPGPRVEECQGNHEADDPGAHGARHASLTGPKDFGSCLPRKRNTEHESTKLGMVHTYVTYV